MGTNFDLRLNLLALLAANNPDMEAPLEALRSEMDAKLEALRSEMVDKLAAKIAMKEAYPSKERYPEKLDLVHGDWIRHS
jgi:hypothetical protein